ncbi:MAG: DUF4249 domain-containing protein [Flavobacteriaceae bacterium]|nr:DUF4249 domain-containing protein [Flavobacteriaceae bacterium]
MKKILKYTFLFIGFLFFSCTDVIDVDVPFDGPRLVIEASINWKKGKPGNKQTIKLSKLTPYFDTITNSQVTGAMVKITNDQNGSITNFIDQNNGDYITEDFVPIVNQPYTLEVNYNGETYIAQEMMKTVVPISRVEQSKDFGFDNKVIALNMYFDDPVDEENYYLTKFHRRKDLFPNLLDINDGFTNGNEMIVFFEKFTNEDENEFELVPGDIVDIELIGISKKYFNFIGLLIEQNAASGDPFSTTPAPLRGNCINPDNPENFAWGYFRLTEVDSVTYIVE